jgi:hypothetical protein
VTLPTPGRIIHVWHPGLPLGVGPTGAKPIVGLIVDVDHPLDGPVPFLGTITVQLFPAAWADTFSASYGTRFHLPYTPAEHSPADFWWDWPAR